MRLKLNCGILCKIMGGGFINMNNKGIPQVDQALSACENIALDKLTDFSNNLSTIALNTPHLRPQISILPNVVKSVADYVLERKKLTILEKRDKQLIALNFKNIELQDSHDQRIYQQTIKKYELDADIKLAEIESERKTTLAKIESEKSNALAQIKRNRETEILRLTNDYNLQKKQLDAEKEKYFALLRESARRFNETMDLLKRDQCSRAKIHAEALLMCSELRENAHSGQLDQSFYLALLKLAIESQKPDFDLISTLPDILR